MKPGSDMTSVSDPKIQALKLHWTKTTPKRLKFLHG